MVISLKPVHFKANCLMTNRPIHEIRLGPVKAANWLVQKKPQGFHRTPAAPERPRRDSNLRPSV